MTWLQRNRPKYRLKWGEKKRLVYRSAAQLSEMFLSWNRNGIRASVFTLFHWAHQTLMVVRANGGSPGGASGLTLPLLQQTSHPDTKSCTCVGFLAVVNMTWRQT